MPDPMDPIPGTTAGYIHITGWQMGRDAERERILEILQQQTLYVDSGEGYYIPINSKQLLEGNKPWPTFQ
jgi:hypothetical protein